MPKRLRSLLPALGLLTLSAHAQTASEMPNAPTQALQIPLSGRQSSGSGQVSVTQRTTNSGGGNSVNTINSAVTVMAPYNGSVAGSPAAGGTLSLTLENALTLGLRANLGAISEAASVQQGQGQREVAKSQLLPQLSTVISEAYEKINLRTLGVKTTILPLASEFNYYDARAARLNQSVFDLVRIRNLRGASENVQANLKDARNARDLIVLAVGGSYLQLIATEARIQAAQAEVVSFRAIYQQAADRLAAGLATRVDATRSQVQLQTEQQRLRSLQADLDTQKLRFARIIGLSPAQHLDVSEQYSFAPVTDLTEDQAIANAQQNRSDLQASALGVKAAETAVKAAHAEHLPSVVVNADFGAAGVTPTNKSIGVYTVSGTMTIPLYTGGRIAGESDEANAVLKQRRAELDDLKAQVEQDVRQAFIDLGSAADQVSVAESNQQLAHETLTQSRDRFTAGIADTVELVQAEQSVVQADDDFITAVYEHNLGKVSLARAMGNAEQSLPQLLRK